MTIAILIPYRGTNKGKGRLRKDIDDSTVDNILFKMTQHIIEESSKIDCQNNIYLLTRNQNTEFKGSYNSLVDEGDDLNDAVGLASKKLEEDIVLVIMADLPLISKDEIEKTIYLIQETNQAIIAPSQDNGTSLLGFVRGSLTEFVFGKNSSYKFQEIFKTNKIPYHKLNYKKSFKDIDTFKDLTEIAQDDLCPKWLKEIVMEYRKNERED